MGAKRPCSTHSNVAAEERNLPHLDGGWGWVVCFGAFIVHFLTVGQQNIAGVIYSELVDEFGTKRAETAWVTALSSSVMYLFAPLSTYLCERYGCRKVVIFGGVLTAASLGCSSFVTSLPPMYFTYGFGWGVGTSFGLFPSLVILTKYFKRRLSLVTGIALTGAAIGGISLGPLVQLLSSEFGTPNMFRFCASLNVLMIFSGLLYRPLENEKQFKKMAGRSRKFVDWSLFKNKGYVLWMVSLCTLMLVFLVPFIHLVKLAEDLNISKMNASLLPLYMATGGFFGSLLFGKISDNKRCNKLFVCQFAILSMGVVCTLVTIATSYVWLAVLSFFFGAFDGCYEMLVPVITSDIVGYKKTAPAIGTLYFMLAIPKTIGPPVAGWIFDISQSYNTAFYVTGGAMTLSSLLMFLIQTNPGNKSISTGSSASDLKPLRSVTSSTSSESGSIRAKEPKLSVLACYMLPFKCHNSNSTSDYYTIGALEELSVAEKVTSV